MCLSTFVLLFMYCICPFQHLFVFFCLLSSLFSLFVSLLRHRKRVSYRAVKVSLAQTRAARVRGSWKLTWLPGKFISFKCWDEVNALSEETNRKINSLILFQSGTTSSTLETHRKTIYMPLEVSIDGSVSWLHPFSGNVKPGEIMKFI